MRIVIGLAFVLDVILKFIARRFPTEPLVFVSTPAGPIGFIPSVNDVLAFSFPIPNIWIWPIGWIVVVLLVRTFLRSTERRTRTAIVAVMFGAISNLIDRTLLGGVTDYLSFTDMFPAFNVADLLIIGGVLSWVYVERSCA